MASPVLTALDRSLINAFCWGNEQEHHRAELELGHHLRKALKAQEDGPKLIPLPPDLSVTPIGPTAQHVSLSKVGAMAIKTLCWEANHGAEITQVELRPGQRYTLVEVDEAVHCVSMANGSISEPLEP